MSRSTLCIAYVAALTLCLGFGAQQAHGIAILQLFSEMDDGDGGIVAAHYDSLTESWVLVPNGGTVRLWAIGNIAGPGGKGTISDVRLSVAYSGAFYDEDDPVVVSLSGSLAWGGGTYMGFRDYDPPSPLVPTAGPIVSDGSVPMLNPERALPPHGTFDYDLDTVWQEFSLGDFTDETDSHIGDFIGTFPNNLYYPGGQTNVYEVSVSGPSGLILHFDLYNETNFAPFSHDLTHMPEPASIVVWVLLGLTCGGVGWWRRRKLAG